MDTVQSACVLQGTLRSRSVQVPLSVSMPLLEHALQHQSARVVIQGKGRRSNRSVVLSTEY